VVLFELSFGWNQAPQILHPNILSPYMTCSARRQVRALTIHFPSSSCLQEKLPASLLGGRFKELSSIHRAVHKNNKEEESRSAALLQCAGSTCEIVLSIRILAHYEKWTITVLGSRKQDSYI